MRYHVTEAALTNMFPKGKGQFVNADLAAEIGCYPSVATGYIQAYLREARKPDSTAMYSIHRTGQTRNTVWHVGVRKADAQETLRQFGDDVTTRWRRAVDPDIAHIAALNPALGKQLTAMVDTLAKGALTILEGTIRTIAP